MTDNEQQSKNEQGGEQQPPRRGVGSGDDSPNASAKDQEMQEAVSELMQQSGTPGFEPIVDKLEKALYRWMDGNKIAVTLRYYLMFVGMLCTLVLGLAAYGLVWYTISKGQNAWGIWVFAGIVTIACVTAVSHIVRRPVGKKGLNDDDQETGN